MMTVKEGIGKGGTVTISKRSRNGCCDKQYHMKMPGTFGEGYWLYANKGDRPEYNDNNKLRSFPKSGVQYRAEGGDMEGYVTFE